MNKQRCRFAVGDRVVAGAAYERGEVTADFDLWGRGEGVGEVVHNAESWPTMLEDGWCDVRWPAGRCFEREAGLELHE